MAADCETLYGRGRGWYVAAGRNLDRFARDRWPAAVTVAGDPISYRGVAGHGPVA